jgi:hypothetical protein
VTLIAFASRLVVIGDVRRMSESLSVRFSVVEGADFEREGNDEECKREELQRLRI